MLEFRYKSRTSYSAISVVLIIIIDFCFCILVVLLNPIDSEIGSPLSKCFGVYNDHIYIDSIATFVSLLYSFYTVKLPRLARYLEC